MNKKSILIGICILIILTGIVIANELTNKEVPVSKEDKLLFDTIEFTDYEVSAINCNADSCEKIRIYKRGVMNIDCEINPYRFETNEKGESIKVYYTNGELEIQRDKCEQEALARVKTRLLINQQSETYDLKVEGGKRILKENAK